MQNQINQQNPNRQRRFPPICRFFATEAGCRSGVDCAFAHIIPASKEIPGVSSPHESEQTSVEGDTRGKQASSNPSRRVQSHNPERTDQAVIVGQRPYSAQGGHRGGRRNGNNKSPAPPNRQGQRSRLHYNQHKEGSSSEPCEMNKKKRTLLSDLVASEQSQSLLEEPLEEQETRHVSVPMGRDGSIRMAVSRPSVKTLIADDPNKLQQVARTSELEQLERRFRSSHTIIRSDDQETVVQVALPPSDPDFPFELETLVLNITVPTGYPGPGSLCSVKVTNTEIPIGFSRNLEKGFDVYVAAMALPSVSHQTLIQQLNWLDKNMELLLQRPPAATIRFVRNSDRAQSVASVVAAATSEPVIESAALSLYVPELVLAPAPAATQSQTPTYTKQQLDEASARRTQELRQVENRFRVSYKVIKATLEETAIRLVIPPSDPEFAFKAEVGDALELEMVVPTVYPLEPCTIHVLNGAVEDWRKKNIADGFFSHVLEALTSSTLVAVPSIFQHLNWLDRNLENLMRLPRPKPSTPKLSTLTIDAGQPGINEKLPAKSIFRNEKDDEDGLSKDFKKKILFVERPNNGIPTLVDLSVGTDSGIKPERDEEEDSVNDSYTDTESEDDDEQINSIPDDLFRVSLNVGRTPHEHAGASSELQSPSQSNQPQQPRRGTELRLPNIRLDNVALLRCTTLNILLRCARCKGTVEVRDVVSEINEGQGPGYPVNECNLTRKSEKWVSCPTCTLLLGVRFKGDLIHENSSTLGLLQLAGCVPFDLLPSTYQPTCSHCVESSTLVIPQPPLKNVGRDQLAIAVCRNCHLRMTIHFAELKFVRLGDLTSGERLKVLGDDASKLKRKKRQLGKELGIVMGQPLPHQGTCKHYRKSYRWFRFPCCGKLYPCDICHDDAEDHDHELARKIACGFCAREQGMVGKAVCTCGADLVKTYGKGFWEGGQGVREQNLMNRNDSRKHKGTLKTVSKKEQRVGAAGKRAIAEKEWFGMATRGVIPTERK